jgi:Protein of unknown function (DUF1552)
MTRTTQPWRLSRRAVLRGLGGGVASLALPPLDAMLNNHGTAYADGTALPKRFGVFMWPDGVQPAKWVPPDTGASWTMTPQLQPLAAVKNDINILSGFNCKISGFVHHAGTVGMLSGAPYVVTGSGTTTTHSLPTVDVIAARTLGTKTQLPSLEIGVDNKTYPNEGTTGYALSHNGPMNVNPAIFSPSALFDKVFPGAGGGGVADPAAAKAAAIAAAGRKSLLDAVTLDAADLRKRLGSRDRARLDQHLDGIRQVETRLAMPVVSGGAGCPPAGARPGAVDPTLHGATSQAMSDVLALALACDVTRVFSFKYALWHTTTFTELTADGAKEDFHTYTHIEPGDQPLVGKHILLHMQQVAYLIAKLKSITVGAGTLLDQCAILFTTEVQEGRNHLVDNIPMIVAGRAGGALKTGLHVHAAGDNTSKVHLTLLQAVGVPATSFGGGPGLAMDTVADIKA